MRNISVRESQMEKLRSEMYLSFKENRYGEEVINISQKLDDLLNEFIMLPKNK